MKKSSPPAWGSMHIIAATTGRAGNYRAWHTSAARQTRSPTLKPAPRRAEPTLAHTPKPSPLRSDAAGFFVDLDKTGMEMYLLMTKAY